jgi:hypothetical protein
MKKQSQIGARQRKLSDIKMKKQSQFTNFSRIVPIACPNTRGKAKIKKLIVKAKPIPYFFCKKQGQHSKGLL